MPALANSPVLLPQRIPTGKSGVPAGVGPFSDPGRKVSAEALTMGRKNISESDTLDRLAHDARNIMSGLMLYCELLAMPGVLNKQHWHYAQELETIVNSANHLLGDIAQSAESTRPSPSHTLPAPARAALPAVPVSDAAEELRRLQPLLAAIAGSAIKLQIATMPCAGQTLLAAEDLTRILVNLVRNAADAMPAGGHIRITAQYAQGMSFANGGREPSHVLLCVADDGPGIPEPIRALIFEPGFTTRKASCWGMPRRRGLGLNIVRNLVESAGGSVEALPGLRCGTRFEILLPLTPSQPLVTSGTCVSQAGCMFVADASETGCIECL